MPLSQLHLWLGQIAGRSPQRFSKLCSRTIRGKKTYTVELWFDPEFADTVSDTHWHRSQEIEWNGDESIVLRCRVDGLEEIVWWVLSYGPHCVVRKPQELAEQVRALGEAVARNYAATPMIPTNV